ncbi:MAG TPA: CapA family protein [Chloroflexota bacterium]
MARRPDNDRTSVVAFAGVWAVIAVLCFAAYLLTHALGMGKTTTATHAAPATVRPTAALSHPALSLTSIFSAQPPSLKEYNRRQLRTLITTGDVIPARSVNYKMTIYNDFLYPFRRTAGFLRTADITLINMESPLIIGCPVTTEGMGFCGNPRFVEGLKYAGIDVVCTANNHISNYGDAGIRETWQHLSASGLRPCGYQRVAYMTVRGLRFAFIAYNTVGQRFDYAAARSQIQAVRKHADVVIVSVHWGREYVAVPQIAPGIADDNPRHVAHWIIDSGADLIIGNHPHHVQGVEIYRGRLITYAHGNFAFDQMFATPADCPGDPSNFNFMCTTREGVVGEYTFAGKKLVAVRYKPVVIYDYAQPRWATPQQARVILAGMRASSYLIARMK